MWLAAHRTDSEPGETLRRYYKKLRHELGPQGWWPARTRLEVILGAILTQNTSWSNAALALKRLRKAGLLNLERIKKTSLADLETCIYPAGFFRQKSRTIRNFLGWLGAAFGGSLGAMFRRCREDLRRELLQLKGLGPETVDAILLYAGRQPYFVADAYTRRILARHNLVTPTANYAAVQEFLHQSLPPDQALFNELHALLVETGKRYCKRRVPRCGLCPLEPFLARHSLLRMGSSAGHDERLRRLTRITDVSPRVAARSLLDRASRPEFQTG